MGYHRKRRATEGQKERDRWRERARKRENEGGRMQWFMKKEETTLIDVEHVKTTSERCCHLSWRTPLNSSLCTFIGMKHISPTFSSLHLCISYQCIWGWQHWHKPSPKCHFTYIFAIFSLCGSTHDSADCWSAHQIHSCPRQLQTCSPLMQGWVASAGCPPNKNPGYAGGPFLSILSAGCLAFLTNINFVNLSVAGPLFVWAFLLTNLLHSWFFSSNYCSRIFAAWVSVAIGQLVAIH